MDAREIESLSMLQRGFSELKDANAELAYNVILDILQGINEWVSRFYLLVDVLKFTPEHLPSNSMFKRHADFFHTNGLSGRAK